MFNISFGCCRHSVSNTFVQLTEGRSARDQPKQPPAKKTCLEESLLSLAKLRLEEVWKSFTEHTKCVDVWLKNDSEKGP